MLCFRISRSVSVSRSGILLWAMLGLLAGQLPAGAAPNYDLIVRGGLVFDGTGSPRQIADIGVTADRIAFVGSLPATATATREIDATGKWVTPGFIDGHTHAAAGLAVADRAAARNHLAQGVTTVFINPDGGGPADLDVQQSAILSARPGVNVAPLIGHNAVRIAVLDHATRAPSPAELRKMQQFVRQAMEQGAFGFSSGPFYAPGSFSDTDEIVALAEVVATFGGFHTSHVRDESDYTIGVVAAVEEVIEVSRRAKLTGVVTHIKALGPGTWGASAEIIRRIDAARAAGLSIYADQYPYEAGSTSLAAALLPRWAQEGGQPALRQRLHDEAQLPKLRDAIAENLVRRGGAGSLQIRSYRPAPSYEGQRLDAVATALQLDAVATVIHLLRRASVDIISFSIHEDDIVAFMRQPWTMTSSDGDMPVFGSTAAHPRSYGSFARKLRRYAMEQNVVSVERAIHSMSGQPAAVFGVRDRGVLQVGAFADLAVIDPQTLRDTSTYTQPHAYAEGVAWVVVNGQIAYAEGAPTVLRAGRWLIRN